MSNDRTYVLGSLEAPGITVTCPKCSAPAGQPCKRAMPGEGQHHPSRLRGVA